MARFRNQVSKGIEAQSDTDNQVSETKNQILEDGKNKPKTKNQKPKTDAASEGPEPRPSVLYSESDLEPVNVAGFKVPYVVREHWKKGCREKRVKLSPMLKKILADEFGLPPGINFEDL